MNLPRSSDLRSLTMKPSEIQEIYRPSDQVRQSEKDPTLFPPSVKGPSDGLTE